MRFLATHMIEELKKDKGTEHANQSVIFPGRNSTQKDRYYNGI